MDGKQKVKWSKRYNIRAGGYLSERIGKEYIYEDDITMEDFLSIEKNRCVKHILETIELAYGKNSGYWSDIRRIILRSINDYHRSVLKLVQKLEKQNNNEVDE